MKSRYCLDESDLKNELHIEKLGHRHRLLTRLREAASIRQRHKRESSHEMLIESETFVPACISTCEIM